MPKSPSPHSPSRSAKYFSFRIATSASVRTNRSVASMLVDAIPYTPGTSGTDENTLCGRRHGDDRLEIGHHDHAAWPCRRTVRHDERRLPWIPEGVDDQR